MLDEVMSRTILNIISLMGFPIPYQVKYFHPK